MITQKFIPKRTRYAMRGRMRGRKVRPGFNALVGQWLRGGHLKESTQAVRWLFDFTGKGDERYYLHESSGLMVFSHIILAFILTPSLELLVTIRETISDDRPSYAGVG